jgi:uncharacterized protein (TIGR02001 family)
MLWAAGFGQNDAICSKTLRRRDFLIQQNLACFLYSLKRAAAPAARRILTMGKPYMSFSRLALSAIASAILLAAPVAWAQDKKDDSGIPGDLTGSLALTTDYVFRGISQTDSGPAVQGTIDYAYMFRDEIGIYAGIFGSNVDFDEVSGPGVDRASAEFDLYGGVKGTISGVTWQLGFIHYAYPKSSPSPNFDYDYTEVVGKLGYDFGVLAITAGVNYTGDYFSETGEGVYYRLSPPPRAPPPPTTPIGCSASARPTRASP